MVAHLVTLLCLSTALPAFSVADVHVCSLADDPNGCAMTSRVPNGSTESSAPPMAKNLMLVKPGGDTICLDNSDYGFLVSPGSEIDKLLFNFAGGGGCLDEFAFQSGLCVTSLEGALRDIEYGVFDRTNSSNPFQNYTFVHVPYCSGDNHLGNVSRNWGGAARRQAGYYNALSAVRWTLANVGKLASLVFMGQSAGSVGLQLWAEYLLKIFDYERSAVIADSFAFVFPPAVQTLIFEDGGACDLPIFTEDVQAKCNAGEITLQDLFGRAIKKNSEVNFGMVQSKIDEVELFFYNAIIQGLQLNMSLLTPAEFLVEANKIFQGYNGNSNFVLYSIDGSHHVFTNLDVFFTAGTLGAVNGSSAMQPLLFEWIKLLASRSSTVRNECAGPRKPNEVANGDRFCDEMLFYIPKPWPAWTYFVIGAIALFTVVLILAHRLRNINHMHASSSDCACGKTETV